jgi:cytochrome c5
VDFRPTMNQPTVDSTEDDVVETSHDVKVNVNIVTPTKKATKKKPTKATSTALKPPQTKENTKVKVIRRLCHLCHQQAALE